MCGVRLFIVVLQDYNDYQIVDMLISSELSLPSFVALNLLVSELYCLSLFIAVYKNYIVY